MASFDLGKEPSLHHSKRPGYDGTSLQSFFAAFPDDAACLAHVFKVRFGPDPACPRCGAHGRWRKHDVQKHFFHPCGGILSPMADIVFSRTRVPLQLWFYALLHFVDSAEGIANPFLARMLAISIPTAFRLSTRVRLHMAMIDAQKRFADDSPFISARIVKILRVVNQTRNRQNSANVFMLSDGRIVNSTVMDNVSQRSLREVITRKVSNHHALKTDCYQTYNVLRNYSSGKPIAEFRPELFHDSEPSENAIHGFLQYLNLSFANQYMGVSLGNFWLFLKEYEYRYNRRCRSVDAFSDLISNFPRFDPASLAQVKAAAHAAA